MKKQAKDTKKKATSKVKDLSPKKDVKGGGTGVPLRDKEGNLAGTGKIPVR